MEAEEESLGHTVVLCGLDCHRVEGIPWSSWKAESGPAMFWLGRGHGGSQSCNWWREELSPWADLMKGKKKKEGSCMRGPWSSGIVCDSSASCSCPLVLGAGVIF